MSKLKQPLDLLAFDGDLTTEQVTVRDRVRAWCSESVSPLINDAWRDGKFPFSLTTHMGELGCFGTSIDGYGCPGRSPIVSGLIMRELERCDSGLRTMASVQSALSMNAIHDFGSEVQKSHWLPAMARGEALGCFALTEPGFGSNPAGLQTRATRDGTGWILSGEKKWIGNALSASVAIVWAKLGDADDPRSIRGFLVETDAAGYSASVIDNKYSLRIAETCADATRRCTRWCGVDFAWNRERLTGNFVMFESRALRHCLGGSWCSRSVPARGSGLSVSSDGV